MNGWQLIYVTLCWIFLEYSARLPAVWASSSGNQDTLDNRKTNGFKEKCYAWGNYLRSVIVVGVILTTIADAELADVFCQRCCQWCPLSYCLVWFTHSTGKHFDRSIFDGNNGKTQDWKKNVAHPQRQCVSTKHFESNVDICDPDLKTGSQNFYRWCSKKSVLKFFL